MAVNMACAFHVEFFLSSSAYDPKHEELSIEEKLVDVHL